DDDSGDSAGKYELQGKGGSGGSETDSERSAQSRGFGTPEQVKKTMAEVHGRLESGGEHEQHDQRRGDRKGKDTLCPTWDGKDLSEWPEKRLAIDRWNRLTAVPPEEQGETLLLHLTKEAATATRHLRLGSVQYAGGLQAVILALDTLAFPEADAETFQQLVLIQTGYDYNVNRFVSILKRMADDSTVTEKSAPTKGAYLAGIDEDEPLMSEGGDTESAVCDAMANLLGIDDDGTPGGQEPADDGERILTEVEALDCLAAIVPPPTKPRTWGEARKIVADKKTNREFRNLQDGKKLNDNIEDIKKRTKCGTCKKVGHWHQRECPDNPKNKNMPTGGFVAMTVLQDDEICSYIVTEAKMASRSILVEHINLAIDIETSGRLGWGALDTACGFNMMGLDTYAKWEIHCKKEHGITLHTIPYHKKYRFGNDQICTATDGAIIPIMLGDFVGLVFVCLVQGAAPLLLSKTFVVELEASLHAFQFELELPEQSLRLPLAHAGGEHFLLQLDNFTKPWSKPEGWTLCTKEDQFVDLTETTEQEEWETRGDEVLDQPPRSKAPIALKELLQDENANAMTNQLVENLRGHLGADISDQALKVLGETDKMREAMEDAIPECTAFLGQLGEQVRDGDEMMETGGVPLHETTERKQVMVVAGHHLLARRGQKEAWNMIKSASPLLVIIKPPKDIYNKKLKEKIGRDVLTFMSDMAIQQAINGRYFYYEQASEYGEMLSQEFAQGSLQNKLGDAPMPLQELTGASARAIVKAKVSDLATVETKMDDEISSLQRVSRCPAPVSNNEDERGADPHVKQQGQKMHENMGHCSNENLVMVLKYGRARQAFIEAAQHLVCPSCEANERPRMAKPAKAPTTYQFNGVIGMDIFFVLGLENTTKVPMLNIVCRGAGHQVVIPLPSRQGQQIRRHYRAFWERAYGTPRIIVIDGEKGFSTGEFPDAAEGDGAEVKVASATSPWQAGKTERAGGTWKETFYRTRQKFNAKNWGDFYELVDSVNAAIGESVRRGGFTPYQRVFGRPFQLPEKILEEGSPSLATVSRAMNGDTELARSIGMRKAAMAASIEAECTEKRRRALNIRSRPQRGATFQPGGRCYFWRSSTDKLPVSSWHGPARAIQTELPSTVWCSYQGGLLKCSPEQLRHANEGEISAWEQIDHAMKEEVGTDSRGRRTYEDLTKQPAPAEEEVLDDVPPTAPPEPAGNDQPAASLEPPTVEIERSSDVRADPILMGPQCYDDLDDVPITSKKALVNPDAAMPVAQRIATIEEVTEKSLLNTYRYQPSILAKRREWANIQKDPALAARIMGFRWVLTDKDGDRNEPDASKKSLLFMNGSGWRMAKARWTVQGHTDPDLLELETYSPVVGKDSVFLILQILCTNKWTLQLADITSAFTAGDPLDSYAKEIGFQCSIFDGCVFYLRDDEGLHGVMGLTVDDIVGGGDQKFDEKGKYTGKELDHNDDNTEITISQCQSSANIQQIDIATERRETPQSPVTPAELHQARSLRGSIAFLARGKVPNLTVDDLLEADRIGRMTKEFCEVVLKVRCIVFATQRKILEGEAATISIQSWKSHKLKRKCAHQFGAETLAISEGMAMAELIRTMLLEIVDSEFDLMRPYLLAGRFPVISVTDSRGGYDHVTNPKAGLSEDKRAAIDVAIMRSAMQRPQVHLRWIEGTSQLTDRLTKRKGESTLLRHALELGEYGITADSIVLRRREQERQMRKKKGDHTYACSVECCFSGLDLYEMDCTGTLK
ncbi:unnamed protein product, partial [Prorocentrum cordatum]